MRAVVSAGPYWSAVGLAAAGCLAACVSARRRPGPWRFAVARLIGAVLLADVAAYTAGLVLAGTWSAGSSLPLALCNVAVLVVAVACWRPAPLLVELTYFWGLAGTLQGVVTPDLRSGFPHLVFFEYVVGHLGIVVAALFLVIGLRLVPRPGAVPRVFALTAAYTALVGVVDWTTGANYMFLRRQPDEWTLLRLLGPWPWYLFSAGAVGLALLVLLDMPFWPARRRSPRAGRGPVETVVGPRPPGSAARSP